MWYHDTLGLVRHPRELTISGVTYPRQIFRKWSKPELAEIGIRPARMEVVDQRYYTTGGENYTLQGNEWVISYGSVPKDADSLKKSMKEKVKQMVRARFGSIMPKAMKKWRVVSPMETTTSSSTAMSTSTLASASTSMFFVSRA